MIYFDSAYVVKCYIREHGSPEVRRLAESGEPVSSLEIARVEFSAAVHRQYREGGLSAREVSRVFHKFQSDCRRGYWTFYPISSQLVEDCAAAFRSLPRGVFLRSMDAMHLVCARSQGFRFLYSNDRHVRSAALHFGLEALDVVPAP